MNLECNVQIPFSCCYQWGASYFIQKCCDLVVLASITKYQNFPTKYPCLLSTGWEKRKGTHVQFDRLSEIQCALRVSRSKFHTCHLLSYAQIAEQYPLTYKWQVMSNLMSILIQFDVRSPNQGWDLSPIRTWYAMSPTCPCHSAPCSCSGATRALIYWLLSSYPFDFCCLYTVFLHYCLCSVVRLEMVPIV